MQFHTAFRSADILLPNDCDMQKWAVIACDQFTSEPEYWHKTEEIVGDSLSTYNLVLPEIYLGKADTSARIEKINDSIDSYLSSGIFTEYRNSMIYVKRVQSDGKLREGIVGAVDLEKYDYRAGSASQIRATEATVVERIPPRLEIRQDAALELPHIMILIDDPERTVIEPLSEPSLEKLYDFTLMQNGGSISGYLLGEDEISRVDKALYRLAEESELLYAIGDGNHSLATAKEHYERLKRENPDTDFTDHPARYALCEIVNLHSDALEFEAIHRIVTGADADKLINALGERLGLCKDGSGQRFEAVIGGDRREYFIGNPLSELAVGSVQAALNEYLKANVGEADYIHGEETLVNLSMTAGSVGFIFEPMKKSGLFPAVIAGGALPRKTFSMGTAYDKRYYLEAKRIR